MGSGGVKSVIWGAEERVGVVVGLGRVGVDDEDADDEDGPIDREVCKVNTNGLISRSECVYLVRRNRWQGQRWVWV